jgi:tRNA A-37 threonylcarbamoyl transferase component Bud32
MKKISLKQDNIDVKEHTGKKGKDGNIYKVLKKNTPMIAKIFRKNKNSEEILQEYKFQTKAYKLGISPKTYGYSIEDKKYILMEEMEETLYEIIKRNNFEMPLKYQKQFLEIMNILDENKIFHSDTSPLNFMTKNEKLYIIDFGLSCKIDKKCVEKNGENPNFKLGIIFFIIKTRLVFPKFTPEYLIKKVEKKIKN